LSVANANWCTYQQKPALVFGRETMSDLRKLPMLLTHQAQPKVAIAGWGALGKLVVQAVLDDMRYKLVAVGSQQSGALDAYLAAHHSDAVVCGHDKLAALSELADVVIECLSPRAFPALALALEGSGKTVIVLSAAALLKQQTLMANAQAGGVKLVVATGAIMGLDAVRAMCRDGITDCLIVNRKRP
jgi:aspartate dehydrogenase